jgi:hypothetical protein
VRLLTQASGYDWEVRRFVRGVDFQPGFLKRPTTLGKENTSIIDIFAYVCPDLGVQTAALPLTPLEHHAPAFLGDA